MPCYAGCSEVSAESLHKFESGHVDDTVSDPSSAKVRLP